MNYITIIGLTAATLITVANIPQTYKIIKEKDTKNISATTYVLLLLGNALWLTYGILNVDWPIIVGNSISVVTCLIILLLNFTSHKTMNAIHKKVIPKAQKSKK